MTRTHTKLPAWTWMCDECGREESLSRDQVGLPEPEQMRQRGWFIAELFGDKCPKCNREVQEID